MGLMNLDDYQMQIQEYCLQFPDKEKLCKCESGLQMRWQPYKSRDQHMGQYLQMLYLLSFHAQPISSMNMYQKANQLN